MIQWLRELYCHFINGGHDWKFINDRKLNGCASDEDEDFLLEQVAYIEQQCTKCKTVRFQRL